MLNVSNLHVYYGGIHAVQGISIHVPKGKIVTLVGSNGAGKSSTIRAITGLVKKISGSITYSQDENTQQQELCGLAPEAIIRQGISMSPEGRRILPHLTVLENLKLGAYIRKDKAEIKKDITWVYSLFPRLQERLWQKAGTLSGGEQQMLAVGRALMSRPKILILDEPSLGLAPLLVQEIFDIILKINSQGKTILLVEQNAFTALSIADYAYVLEVGNIVMEGSGADLLTNPRVKEAYLGG